MSMMRGILFLCFVAVASASKLGYNYRPAVDDRRFADLIDREATGFSASDTRQQQQQQQLQQQQQQQQLLGPQAAPDEFNKEFYTYAAPEEDFADREATQQIANMLKRSLRVLFIKSPEHQGLTNAALQLAKQSSEQRTAIYVLTKQADVGELAQRLQSEKQNFEHKPEVHFVKYRTPEDALRAQQLIQQQFNALGGSSRSSDEGVAPVLDFSSAPIVDERSPAQSSVGSKYLPAA
ncbi:PREDICTED: basic-leucine zipper transcription factor A [Drosophila arizonae]|uniref:Basic-leucine zipper transcription factor A n=1 Tax=Drosophila arizonae TaxID=7263 RepID=A0ABM1NQA5_DROAR|nr:PREDICTED: basic-leucine zipper transcription factor A [Drosophila arizonae]XP_017857148.1 PREDICTED: basic-leucine zipper transcription factor A [Drosophila arizonae]